MKQRRSQTKIHPGFIPILKEIEATRPPLEGQYLRHPDEGSAAPQHL